MKLPLRFLAILPLLAACSGPGQPAAEAPATVASAEEAVMARHDSLMARTDRLYTLKERLTKALATAPVPALQARGTAAVLALGAADQAMMDWMHQYHAPDSAAAEALRLAYFRQQQAHLDAVERRFAAATDSAQAVLARLGR